MEFYADKLSKAWTPGSPWDIVLPIEATDKDKNAVKATLWLKVVETSDGISEEAEAMLLSPSHYPAEFGKIGPDVFGWEGVEIKPTYKIGSDVLRKYYRKGRSWRDNDVMNVQPLQEDLEIDGGTYIIFDSFVRKDFPGNDEDIK